VRGLPNQISREVIIGGLRIDLRSISGWCILSA
jgi:hypothetical protein